MQAQIALDHVRHSLGTRLGLTALDQPLRTKVHYFRAAAGRVFGVRAEGLVALDALVGWYANTARAA